MSQVPQFDVANELLDAAPAQLTVSLVDHPTGQRLALTIRTATTTLSVLLAQPDARTWAQTLSSTAGQMSGAGLVVAGAAALPVNGKAAP